VRKNLNSVWDKKGEGGLEGGTWFVLKNITRRKGRGRKAGWRRRVVRVVEKGKTTNNAGPRGQKLRGRKGKKTKIRTCGNWKAVLDRGSSVG